MVIIATSIKNFPESVKQNLIPLLGDTYAISMTVVLKGHILVVCCGPSVPTVSAEDFGE